MVKAGDLKNETKLMAWTKTQRRGYLVYIGRKKQDGGDKTMMTKEKVEALESIGFDFQSTTRADLVKIEWMNMFERMKAHREERGDCNVKVKECSTEDEKKLARWVTQQRVDRKRFEEERRNMREEEERKGGGGICSGRGGRRAGAKAVDGEIDEEIVTLNWGRRKHYLERKVTRISRRSGDADEEDSDDDESYDSNDEGETGDDGGRRKKKRKKRGPQSNPWLDKNETITERIRLLDEIGFSWSVSQAEFMSNLRRYKEHIKDHIKEHGYGRLHHGKKDRKNGGYIVEPHPLYSFVEHQRSDYRRVLRGDDRRMTLLKLALLVEARFEF
mmetsp:Transcript_47812/g.144587  ORF Transcript_47812/g.144587 Transcript_47812/m.144587 type:complete len:330 (-) Transcript_47812:1329-2318(-)